MGLSEWPEGWEEDAHEARDVVKVVFDDPLLCVHKTRKAIFLGDPDEDGTIILPISQLESEEPELNEWVEEVRIPRWLAEDKNLGYDD